MKNTPVYCSLIEIQPLDGCELDPAEIAGAAVRCYIPAANADHARAYLQIELGKLRMRLVEMEWCVDFASTEWETPSGHIEDDFVAEARVTGRIVFDSFHSWGYDAPDISQ